MAKSDYILLTGVTGLVGQYVLRDLLTKGQRVAVLVRAAKKNSARDRVELILQRWEQLLDRSLPRPIVLEGDVSKEHLGLNASGLNWLGRCCDQVMHSAASLKFHGADRRGEPWSTNVGGTQNVLDVCRATGIERLHYVSTAYVAGCRENIVREDELDVGQSHRNDYERSKVASETLVREADFLKSLTVYRPAVISGDSRNGYTATYHGLYLYLRLMAMLVPTIPMDEDGSRHTNIRVPMSGNEGRNIVPVDWVGEVLADLVLRDECHGRTYHLTPDKLVTPKFIIDACSKYFNSTGVEFCGADSRPDLSSMTSLEQSFFSQLTIYQSYETTDPRFDKSNLNEFAGHLPCPEIDEAVIHRYLQFGEADRWGKTREPQPAKAASVGDYLHTGGLLPHAASWPTNEAGRQVFGLDAIGPGGGQWEVTLHNEQLVQVRAGLPPRGRPVLRLPAKDMLALASAADARPLDQWTHAEREEIPQLSHLVRTALAGLVQSQPSNTRSDVA